MSRVVLEMIENGPYGDGWDDITCIGARFQEQYRRVDGVTEFRHRPTYKMLCTFPDIHTVHGQDSVRHDEPWSPGPSRDGCGRTWKV